MKKLIEDSLMMSRLLMAPHKRAVAIETNPKGEWIARTVKIVEGPLTYYPSTVEGLSVLP